MSAQNEVTFDYLSQIPFREAVRERLTELWNYPKYGVPERVGDYYFFFENDGLQNQSILYRQKGEEGAPEVFLDPNTLSDEGTVALVDLSFSQDDRYLAYAVSASGSDWVEIRIREVATGRDLADVIKWVKFSGAIWSEDGFYYSGYEAPTGEAIYSDQTRGQRIMYHQLGATQAEDELIYEDPAHPLRYMSAAVSRDNSRLYISLTEGTHGTQLITRPIGATARPFGLLFEGFESDYELVYAKGDRALFMTNDGAENNRLIAVDFVGDSPTVTTLIEQSEDRMQSVAVAGESLMVTYLHQASSRVEQYTLAGDWVRTLSLPGLGTTSGFNAPAEDSTTCYAYTDFTQPATIYRYDLRTGSSELFRAPTLTFDPADFETRQLLYPSKDGTLVSLFVVHRKGLELDGTNPLYMYGYGGFAINRTPTFSPQQILLMEQGGVYALVNLRGGAEYGEAWHRAGMLEQKQNVFDDFIAAGEFLIASGYTSAVKLGIAGGSNGGLLVGACMTQRPDLFAVALPAVGVLDMLRYHLFTVGWGWVVEYGSSERPDEFDYLYRYSPLHNVERGTCYPATLITTADHDDRVVPAHSFKFAATLQAAQGCERPTLIRIDTNAGHGAGKPTSKKIEETADQMSFFFYNTDTPYQK